MSDATPREEAILRFITELAAALTGTALYGAKHPRSISAFESLRATLDQLLASSSGNLPVVALGSELFVDGQPFTRLSRQAPALVRRFGQAEIEHVNFRSDVPPDELRAFLAELSGMEDGGVRSRPHIQVGRVATGSTSTADEGENARHLATFRDRVAFVQGILAGVAAGSAINLADLDRIVESLASRLEENPNPLAHTAPWEGDERWPAVHAHNVAVLTMGLARLAGTSDRVTAELGRAGALHDIGRVFTSADIIARELRPGSSELEVVGDHPLRGLEICLAQRQLGAIVPIVVFEHHLRFAGGGEPTLPRPRRPHPAARLVTVADVLDTLLTTRASRGFLSEADAAEWIAYHEGGELDPAWAGAARALLALST